jgi:hypothetical protein
MATGFPAVSGDILSASMYNGLVSFAINTQTAATYTAASTDQYQVLVTMNYATANTFKIPTNASVAFPIGTVITVLALGAGTCTISAVTSGTTTVVSVGATPSAPSIGTYKSAACIKTGTDTWVVVGSIA